MYSAVIIDDEKWTLIDIKKTFPWKENDFVIVGETTNAQKGLTLIQQLHPDFVLTDVQMPGMSGIELIQKIREQGIDTEVVVVSGFASFEYAQSMLKYGAFAYCLKPLQRIECNEVFCNLKNKLTEKHSSHPPNPLFEQADKIENIKFQKLIKKVLTSYSDELTLTELSEEFGFNPNYCCTLFSKVLDTTFSKYLTSVRISAAKELMLENKYSLEEIAARVGYSNVFYFSTVFKKQEAVSPREYQKKHRLSTDEKNIPDTD